MIKYLKMLLLVLILQSCNDLTFDQNCDLTIPAINKAFDKQIELEPERMDELELLREEWLLKPCEFRGIDNI